MVMLLRPARVLTIAGWVLRSPANLSNCQREGRSCSTDQGGERCVLRGERSCEVQRLSSGASCQSSSWEEVLQLHLVCLILASQGAVVFRFE